MFFCCVGRGVLDDAAEKTVRRAVTDPRAQGALISLAETAGEGFEELLSEFTGELFGVHLLERDARTWQALLGDAGENFFLGFVVSGIVQGASRLGDFADSCLSPREMGSYLAYSVDQELRNPTADTDKVIDQNDKLHQETAPDKRQLDTREQTSYNKRQQLIENNRKGNSYADGLRTVFSSYFPGFGSEITVRMPSGTRFRPDSIGRMEEGELIVFEFKSSQNPRLSKNQREGFRELETGAGVVVGKGKAGFERGTRIPPVSEGTRIIIKSPNDTKLIGSELDDHLWEQLRE